MSIYKLTYFNTRGTAELARLIFAQAEVEYEDVRLDRRRLQPDDAFDILPLLEVDGNPIPGCRPITRFLARQLNLAGSDDVEAAQLDSISDLVTIKLHDLLFKGS